MSEEKIYTKAELDELIKEKMEALGFTDAMPGQLSYLAKSMQLLVGGGERDPRIPEELEPKPLIFAIRDKSDMAVKLATETNTTLTTFMGTTTTQLSALQKGQHKSRSMISRGVALLRKEITDKEDGKIDWKRVGLFAGAVVTAVHGAFTWIPRVTKSAFVWFSQFHF